MACVTPFFRERCKLSNKVDLLEKIEHAYPKFSKGQKKIANYIIKNYDKAAFMTAATLSDNTGVSCSTVVRFAVELGYEGYPELQKSLQEMVRTKLTAVQRMEVTSNRMGDRDVLSTILNYDILKIKQTLDEIDKSAFEQAVETISNAKNIYILGIRSSASLAGFLGFYLNLIFDNVKMVGATSTSEIFEQILRIGKDDVVISISFPRYSARTVKALQYAKNQDAKIVAITDSLTSPLTQYANHTLIARSDIASFVDSLVAPLSVINALIVALGMRKKENVYSSFDKLEKIWDEYNVYEKVEK